MIWERLTAVRTLLLSLFGFTALCVAAFLFTAMAGWAAVGVSALALAYLTDPRAEGRTP